MEDILNDITNSLQDQKVLIEIDTKKNEPLADLNYKGNLRQAITIYSLGMFKVQVKKILTVDRRENLLSWVDLIGSKIKITIENNNKFPLMKAYHFYIFNIILQIPELQHIHFESSFPDNIKNFVLVCYH